MGLRLLYLRISNFSRDCPFENPLREVCLRDPLRKPPLSACLQHQKVPLVFAPGLPNTCGSQRRTFWNLGSESFERLPRRALCWWRQLCLAEGSATVGSSDLYSARTIVLVCTLCVCVCCCFCVFAVAWPSGITSRKSEVMPLCGEEARTQVSIDSFEWLIEVGLCSGHPRAIRARKEQRGGNLKLH